ncbi:MAG: class I SAM-dependent methyltransferase [Christensenellaceae bacterium]|nr:class I SAM-dependent methyltransferase [Christensenellaceae bacterium]
MLKNKCLICGCNTHSFESQKLKCIYHKCENCEFIFKDKANIVSLNEELRLYKLHNNSINDEKYVAYFKSFLSKAVFPYANSTKTWLDFGSGPEPVLAQILKRDYNIEADIYDKFFAKDKVFIGEKYDVISSTEVAEHIADPLEYFRLLKSLLNKNGILAIMTKFHPNDETQFLNWQYVREQCHISFYSIHTMQKIAEIIGFEIIYTDNVKCITFKTKS